MSVKLHSQGPQRFGIHDATRAALPALSVCPPDLGQA